MPYYTAPGGAMTAAYARSLMGLGVSMPRNSTMYVRPTASAIAIRAANSVALGRRSQRAGTPVMSGMGLGILPSTNVRYAKTAIPAGIARRKWDQRRRRAMSGLGAGRHAMSVAPIMGIRHQPGFFMGPGGGPGGGPFTFPGYGMTGMGLVYGLGQDDDDGIDTTMIDDTGSLIPPSFSTVPSSSPYSTMLPGIPAVTPIDTTMISDNSSLVAPPTAPAAANPYAGSSAGFTPANQAPTGLLPGQAPSAFSQLMSAIFGPAQTTTRNAQGVTVSTPVSTTLTSVLPILLVAGVGVAVLGMIKKR
jgi:hypothetical protein